MQLEADYGDQLDHFRIVFLVVFGRKMAVAPPSPSTATTVRMGMLGFT